MTSLSEFDLDFLRNGDEAFTGDSILDKVVSSSWLNLLSA